MGVPFFCIAEFLKARDNYNFSKIEYISADIIVIRSRYKARYISVSAVRSSIAKKFQETPP